MQNEAMELLKSIERTSSKTFARLTQEQVEQRKSNQAILQQVEAIGRQVTRLCSQIPEQNREGASYGIRHVQDQYKHRTHNEDNRDPEVKQRLKEQVKGYATTIRATEAERRPPQADPFSQLFNDKGQQDEIDPRRSTKTSQENRDRHNEITGWVQTVGKTPQTRDPMGVGTDPRATPRQEAPKSTLRPLKRPNTREDNPGTSRQANSPPHQVRPHQVRSPPRQVRSPPRQVRSSPRQVRSHQDSSPPRQECTLRPPKPQDRKEDTPDTPRQTSSSPGQVRSGQVSEERPMRPNITSRQVTNDKVTVLYNRPKPKGGLPNIATMKRRLEARRLRRKNARQTPAQIPDEFDTAESPRITVTME